MIKNNETVYRTFGLVLFVIGLFSMATADIIQAGSIIVSGGAVVASLGFVIHEFGFDAG